MYNFLPQNQTPPLSPTQRRHERVKSDMTPIVFIYAVGLILFCVTGLISSLI